MASASDIARTVWRKVADAAEQNARRAPLAFDPRPGPQPAVYFLTPDHPVPAGGIRVIYRHVDILNAHGIDAWVLHRRPGFRCRWFENDTRVTTVGATTIRHGDVLVVPEVEVDVLDQLPAGVGRVIFNQNAHLTWKRDPDAGRHYAPHPDLKAVLCVSDHNREMLQRAFPGAPVRRLRLSVDPALFAPPSGDRPRRIAYMPRRGRNDALQVIAMLKASPLIDGWEIVALDGLSHEDVAAQLKTARIFLAFTGQEGFGLPAAEAMACGCYVIGNDGFGGGEFFLRAFSERVETGDIVGFVRAVERALSGERSDPDWCAMRGRSAARFIRHEYAPRRERDDVIAAYGAFVGAARGGEAAPG